MRSLHVIIIFLAGLLLAASCKEEQPERSKDLIDPAVLHNPRSANGIPEEERALLPIMHFDDTTHNFGTVNEGEKLVHEFTFTNTGKSPLLISGAIGTCGCTVADYPREPIAPGKTAVMKTIFNTEGKPGHQEKGITISANTEIGTQYLSIQADVTPAKK